MNEKNEKIPSELSDIPDILKLIYPSTRSEVEKFREKMKEISSGSASIYDRLRSNRSILVSIPDQISSNALDKCKIATKNNRLLIVEEGMSWSFFVDSENLSEIYFPLSIFRFFVFSSIGYFMIYSFYTDYTILCCELDSAKSILGALYPSDLDAW